MMKNILNILWENLKKPVMSPFESMELLIISLPVGFVFLTSRRKYGEKAC